MNQRADQHPAGASIGVGLVLSLLRERAAAARRLATKAGVDDSLLQDRARQLDVIIGEIEAGFHMPAEPEPER